LDACCISFVRAVTSLSKDKQMKLLELQMMYVTGTRRIGRKTTNHLNFIK